MLRLHYCTSYNGLLLYLLYFFSSRLTHDELINKELKCACLVFSYYWGGERAVWRLTALQGPLTKWVLTDGLDTTYHDLLIARPHSSAKCRQILLDLDQSKQKHHPWTPGGVRRRRRVSVSSKVRLRGCQIILSDFSGNLGCKCGNIERQDYWAKPHFSRYSSFISYGCICLMMHLLANFNGATELNQTFKQIFADLIRCIFNWCLL